MCVLARVKTSLLRMLRKVRSEALSLKENSAWKSNKPGHSCCGVYWLQTCLLSRCWMLLWAALKSSDANQIEPFDNSAKNLFLWRKKLMHWYSASGGLLCSTSWCEELYLPQTSLTQVPSVSWMPMQSWARSIIWVQFLLERLCALSKQIRILLVAEQCH